MVEQKRVDGDCVQYAMEVSRKSCSILGERLCKGWTSNEDRTDQVTVSSTEARPLYNARTTH